MSYITLSAPAPVLEESDNSNLVLDLEKPLGPPLEVRVLTESEEIQEVDEPPRKKQRITPPIHKTLDAHDIDQAFASGDIFRLNVTEGAQHIIKRQESKVKFGLVLWSKGIQRLLEPKSADTAPTAPPPNNHESNPPQTDDGSDSLELTADDLKALQDALHFLEKGSYGTTFVYKASESLQISEQELYEEVNAVTVSVISKRGTDLGRCMLNLIRALVTLGRTLGDRKYQPPPLEPRPVKTQATLQAIGRFGLTSDAKRSGSSENHVELPEPAPSTSRRPPPPTLAARFLTPPAVTEAPWSSLSALPDWVLSTLVDLVQRFDGHILATLDQHWYSQHRNVLDFRLFGFTGLHDVVTKLPGVSLKQEGKDFYISVNPIALQDAIRMKWPHRRPTPGLELINTRVPAALSTKLLSIVAANDGHNIGHIQQQFRKGYPNEHVDLSGMGFAKFSDLLAAVPGVQVRKEGSTVTAHTMGGNAQLALVLQLALSQMT